jgi:hypothetical protein
MMLPGLEVLRIVPERTRVPQATIPQTLVERERLKTEIAAYVSARREQLVPPLVLDELSTHAARVIELTGVDAEYRDYVGVLLSNEVWREQLATVPFDRRLLLLPKCLRVEDKCPRRSTSSACCASSAASARFRICRTRPSASATPCSSPKGRPS